MKSIPQNSCFLYSYNSDNLHNKKHHFDGRQRSKRPYTDSRPWGMIKMRNSEAVGNGEHYVKTDHPKYKLGMGDFILRLK